MAAPQQPVIHLVGRPDALWPSAQELADAVPHVRIVASDTLEQQQQDSVQQQDIVQQQGVVVFILTPEAHLAACRARAPFSFIVLWHQSATEDARLRVRAFAAGANMVTFSREALVTALRTACALSLSGSLSCDWCGLQVSTLNVRRRRGGAALQACQGGVWSARCAQRLTPADLWHHHPLWHADHEQLEGACQVSVLRLVDLTSGWAATCWTAPCLCPLLGAPRRSAAKQTSTSGGTCTRSTARRATLPCHPAPVRGAALQGKWPHRIAVRLTRARGPCSPQACTR